MVGRSIAGLLFAAALLLILPRTVAAQTAFQDHNSEIYSLALDPAATPVRFTGRVEVEELSLAAPVRIGGWEITVAFDAPGCRILCAYRRAPDRFGISPPSGLLAPPTFKLDVLGLRAIVFDPAGLGSAHFSAPAETFHDVFCAGGPTLYRCGLISKADPTTTVFGRVKPASLHFYSTAIFTAAPLRI